MTYFLQYPPLFLQIRSLSFRSDLSFSAQSFVGQVEYCALGKQIYAQSLFLTNLLLLLQFPAITVLGPNNGTICWHRGRPRVQRSRVHQQNPNYQPFWQHL